MVIKNILNAGNKENDKNRMLFLRFLDYW